MNAIDDGERLAQLLREAPVPAMSTDLNRAVVAGRRGERIRRYTTATGGGLVATLVLVGATVGVAELRGTGGAASVAGSPVATSPSGPVPEQSIVPPPHGQVSSGNPCQQVDAVTAGGRTTSPRAADPTGRYVVGDGPSAVLWDSGQPRVLPRPPGVAAGALESHAVNARGEVVGLAQAPTQRAWAYRDGRSTLLPLPSGYSLSVAGGINAAGDIVGEAWQGNGPDVAVLWPASGGVQVLRAPGTRYGAGAFAVGDDGTVVGTLNDGGTPYVWPAHGAGHALPNPAGTTGGKAFAIRGEWAAGWAGIPQPRIKPTNKDKLSQSTGLVAARWNLRTGEATAFPSLTDPVTAVNNSGDLLVDVTGVGGTYVHYGQSHTIPGGVALSLPDTGHPQVVGMDTAGTRPMFWIC
jgi:hypothetical protein